ncbi:hypothetical protein [Spirosoma agri]|uniref:Uncharacterized protein n=1 Tax=Spirosoma agri TaxID=1987381 RepID=A0A6M0IMV0_9BACT|nr:hypothetical protein [Spirosoma agri]NEU68253.1 hypothetical protein [Spirosoma agri]
MTLERILLYFAFFVFSALCFNGIRWLLNQPSDLLLVIAGLTVILYAYITIKTKAFTKNPFK